MDRIQHWVWTYHTEDMIPEYQGWAKPITIGSAGWQDDDDEVYWAQTLMVRIPGKRYVIIKIPIKRRLKLCWLCWRSGVCG